jgi:predicted dehydrogenase
VHKWHPGQDWIWEPGGFGVFDPGINAFSIATAIMPQPLFVKSTDLQVPENAQTPIAAEVSFGDKLGASLDWRRSGGEEWTVTVETADGLTLRLEKGGEELTVNGERRPSEGMGEYPAIYAHFLDLIDNRQTEIDLRPLRLVADCLLVGRQHRTAAVER